MRVFGSGIVAVAIIAGGVLIGAQAPPPAAADNAAKVLADARKAMGGETKQGAVKTIVATGRSRRVAGDNLVPVEFEIDIELPDKYVRKDEVPAQESAPSSSGFSGDSLIQIPPPAAPPTPPAQAAAPAPAGAPGGAAPGGVAPSGGAPGAAAGGRPGGPPPMTAQQLQDAQRKARVTTVKQDFARLMLGMFANSFSSYPLTFSYVGQAEAPQGKADVLDAKGAGNFAVRLFINSDTHLPIMVSWTTPATSANIVLTQAGKPAPTTLPPGAIVVEAPAPPQAIASKEDQDAYTKSVAALRQKALAGAKPIETRLYFSDYRDSDGLQFPFRIRRAVGADTLEETTFDRFKINGKIDPKRFDIVK